jgi:putative hydrolase of the HAD superfamily
MHVLLVDFDHTLYPATLPTLTHLDQRITLFIQSFLKVGLEEADDLRKSYCQAHGTTLRGLMEHYGLDPHVYFDFIHQVDSETLPPPDAALNRWLQNLPYPAYVFTNARADWVEKCMDSMGLWGYVGEGKPLLAILDLAFMQWVGKPHPSAYALTDQWIRARHGQDVILHLIDDRLDNLAAAQAQGWQTHWIPALAWDAAQKGHPQGNLQANMPHPETRVWPSLIDLDVATLGSPPAKPPAP